MRIDLKRKMKRKEKKLRIKKKRFRIKNTTCTQELKIERAFALQIMYDLRGGKPLKQMEQ